MHESVIAACRAAVNAHIWFYNEAKRSASVVFTPRDVPANDRSVYPFTVKTLILQQ